MFARLPGREDQGHLKPFARPESQAPAQAQDWVEHETLRVAGILGNARGVAQRPAAADETAPVCLEAEGFALAGGLRREAVGDDDRGLVFLARPPAGQERMVFGQGLGLNEQLVERWMGPVGVVRRHGELVVAGQIEAARAHGPVDERDSSDLDVILR